MTPRNRRECQKEIEERREAKERGKEIRATRNNKKPKLYTRKAKET